MKEKAVYRKGRNGMALSEKIKLICLGDSLTFGYGVLHREKWVTLLSSEYGIPTVNAGANGDTMMGMALRFRMDIIPRYFAAGKSSPDKPAPEAAAEKEEAGRENILFVMGGLNDLMYSGSADSARSGLGTILASSLAAGIPVIVGIPPLPVPSMVGGGFETLIPADAAGALEEYAAWISVFCRAFGSRTVDFASLFRGREKELFGPDGLHPNAAGHALMAEKLAAVLL